MTSDVSDAGQVFVNPERYADEDGFHRACEVLRREDPVHLVEHPDYGPFWAITRHADVYEIETHPAEFTNAPRPVLQNLEADRRLAEQGDLLRTLIHMDDPDHKELRALSVDWFKPSSLKLLEERLGVIARAAVDRMVEHGATCDFARDIAMPMPLQVILAILGLPEEDYPRMLQLTQELFGASDPELARGQSIEDLAAVVADFFTYFSALTEQRRDRPTGDLASVIANGVIRDEPIGLMETISYYVIVATAGHDTTSSAIAGGVQALIEHPDQLARLRANRALFTTAADEIIRWVTPVKHFMRTVTTPYQLESGHRFAPGDWVLLSYPSANRDEEVFGDPFRFDVGRDPNRHLAFGVGTHYCLGARLAKMEIRALLAEFVERVSSIELAGRPELMQTLFVGGLKHLPVRYAAA